MKKMLITCLLGFITFTTAFVVLGSTSEDSVNGDGEYGGPVRRFIQHRREVRQHRYYVEEIQCVPYVESVYVPPNEFPVIIESRICPDGRCPIR